MLFALSVDCENMGWGISWKGQPPNLAADLEDEEFVGSCVLNDQLSIECHGCPFCLLCGRVIVSPIAVTLPEANSGPRLHGAHEMSTIFFIDMNTRVECSCFVQ